MKTVLVSDEMKKHARRGESRIMRTFKNKKPNYTDLHEPDRFYFGILGELAFVKLLRESGIKAKYAPNWNGLADNGDVVVYCNGYPLKVDVKTCSKPFHENLWIPEKQFNRFTYDGYIGVRLVDDMAEIHGYCSKDKFTKTEHAGAKVPNYGIALDQLGDLDKLFDKLDKGATVIRLP